MLALALAAAGCQETDSSSTEAQVLPVEIAVAGDNGPGVPITATGTVVRRREVALSFRVPGVLRAVTADVGDLVRAGTVLAHIDPAAADAQLAAARAATAQTARTLERYDTLAKSGAIARSRYEDERSALLQAKAAEAGAAFERRSAMLVAPVGGPVLARLHQAGETVAAGEAVLRVADERSPLLLRVGVPNADAALLRAGTVARVRFESQGTFAGRVTRIAPLVGADSGTRLVEVMLTRAPGVVSGAVGTATFLPQRTAEGGARVPSEALAMAPDGSALVYTVDHARSVARARRVTFIRFDGEDALVGGLPPGSDVVTAGAGYVRDGQAIATSAYRQQR